MGKRDGSGCLPSRGHSAEVIDFLDVLRTIDALRRAPSRFVDYGRMPGWMRKHVCMAPKPFTEDGPTADVVWLSPEPRVEARQAMSAPRRRANPRPKFNAKHYVTFTPEDRQAPQRHPEKRR